MDLVDALVMVAEPDVGGVEMAEGGNRRGPGLDLEAIELLLAHAYQRGHADGWQERDEMATRDWPMMRASIVQQAVRPMVGFLERHAQFLEELEGFPSGPALDVHRTVDELREAFKIPGPENAFFQGDRNVQDLARKVAAAVEADELAERASLSAHEEGASQPNSERRESCEGRRPEPEVVHGPDWPVDKPGLGDDDTAPLPQSEPDA